MQHERRAAFAAAGALAVDFFAESSGNYEFDIEDVVYPSVALAGLVTSAGGLGLVFVPGLLSEDEDATTP